MNILESLRKIENKIYREQDKSIDLQGMYLTEDVDKEKLWEMINKNDIDGVIKYLTEDLYTVKYSYYTDGDFTDRDIVDGEKTFTDAQEASQFSNFIKKAVGNNLIDLRWDIQDENTTRDWELIDRKTVHDWDGFTTDYTLWKKNGEDYWVCVFGDSDIYGPEDGDFDAEFDNEHEALEWFRYYDDEYEQYHDGDIDECLSLKEGRRNGKFQTVYWLVTRGVFIHGPSRDYHWGVNDESELFWHNIEDGYKTLSSAKNAAKHMMEKSDYDVVIKEYQIEFEDDLTTRKVDAKEISNIKIKNPNRTYPHPEEIEKVLLDAGVRTRLYSTYSDGSSLIVTVYLSEHIFYSNKQDNGHYEDYSETADKIIKVLKDNFNVQELGVKTTKKQQKIDNLDRDDRYQELKFAKYAVTYKDDGISESTDNKELKEAKLGPYKYRYEIRYTAPNGKDYLEGASNDIDKAENVALSGCDHWYESPWESDEHKADVISSYRIIDSDSNSSVETDRLPLYKNKLLKMLTKSKLKEDTNSSFEFRTKDLQSASKIASYIRNHFEVDPITDRDDSYEWYRIKAELTPDQKREARQFVKKFGGYVLGENLKESKKGTVEQMWDGDTYSYHLYVDGKKVGSFWEFDEVEDFAKNHDIILEESLNKKNLKESVYTENGFKNRKEYLNSLADDFGVDVQTVYDLASVLGPDEDFDALVTELEDVAYSQDDDHDGDTEYVGKQFGLTSYYDNNLRGVEDYIELNWGDDPDLEDWIWNKCSQGNYVVLRDWSNGEETKFRPVEEDDIDVKDLIVSKSELFGTSVTESLTEGIELLDSDDLEKYRDTQSQDRDYIGKKLWKDVQSVKELIPEATDEEAALIEKIVKADDEELYRTEDGTIIVAVLSDDDFGYEDAKQYIEDMKFQYEQDPEFYDRTVE